MKILEEIYQYIILSKYIFDKDDIITDTAIHLEREFNQNLLIIDLEKDLVKIIIIIVVSTFLTMGITGKVVQMMIDYREKKGLK